MEIWRYVAALILLALNLNSAFAEEEHRRKLRPSDYDELVQQFDEWVLPNQDKEKYKIIKPKLGPTGIAFSIESNKGISGVLNIATRNLYKGFYSIELKQYQSEYVLKEKHPRNPFNPSVSQNKQNPIDIAFFNENYEDFKWSVEAYSRNINNIRGSTIRSGYSEVGNASNCIYRRYLKRSKWLFWENVYVDKTFVYIRNKFGNDGVSHSDLKTFQSASRDTYVCIIGAVLYHHGVSNIYNIVSEKSEELVPYPAGASFGWGTRLTNMFPLWALRRPEIKAGMTRKDALEAAKKLVPIWAKCCGLKWIMKKNNPEE